jgi:hypothetical protein
MAQLHTVQGIFCSAGGDCRDGLAQPGHGSVEALEVFQSVRQGGGDHQRLLPAPNSNNRGYG